MINNKKVFLVYIIFFFIFLTFLLFPKYGNNTKLYSYFIKEKLETPFGFIGLKINHFYSLFQSNKVHIKNIDQLEKEKSYLININNYLLTITSKYNDQYKIFHENYPTIPTTIGVSVIGDRNLLLNRNFIINKGKKSGFTQKVTEIRIDDDQDSIWLTVDIGDGASCHVGYRSCFYRSIPMGPIENGRKVEMEFLEKEKKFDPEEVYKDQPNPTKI